MVTQFPVAIERVAYQEPAWAIEKTQLYFDLTPEATRVVCQLTLRHRHSEAGSDNAPLCLDGVDLQLVSIRLNGTELAPGQYHKDERSLSISDLPSQCVITIETLINPQANTALEGLYCSSGNFCTQCEAEGFRKITYYLDRPDVLSIFDVTIEADIEQYPVLLSNGNLVEQKTLTGGRHQSRWHDPHPKPSYLFALVAGRLSVIEDHFTTGSNRDVLLQIYVQEHNLAFCDFAMQALKASMRWDEQVYGLEYDLERFMIVAVDDFNMGAMENKGLNIFNSRFVLADIQTSTDTDFLGVEAVIAHEYFHNWTGNRVTCRDWFQLSLKEGLTVFRDQCFSSDMHSSTVKRIEDVRLLRARQFPEDAGPMAHPIRPDSYIEINNFYTLTVYEKGAEVIRMLHTMLGKEKWHAGMAEYFRRHDGSATTCDAFIDAMQSVCDADLTQFRLWYSIAGTPHLTVTEHYDALTREYRLTIDQFVPDTPGQSDKPPLHIPLRMGLLDASGRSLPLSIGQSVEDDPESVILHVTESCQSFVFENLEQQPVASLLRGFSAPVKLSHSQSDEQLALLAAHDPDGFNRWEAVQRLAERTIMERLHGTHSQSGIETLNAVLGKLLQDDSIDDAFKAEALQLPSIDTLAESLEKIDYSALAAARDAVQYAISLHLQEPLTALVSHGRNPQLAALDDRAMGMRKLANTALMSLTYLSQTHWQQLAREQFLQASTMSDRLAALSCLCQDSGELRDMSIEEFYAFAKPHKLVLDKWFTVQATSRRRQVMDDVLALYRHSDFDIANPNRVRALVGGFAMNNTVAFHARGGSGYAFVADCIIRLDALNPQVAASLTRPLTRWHKLIEPQQGLMCKQLQRIKSSNQLSPDVYEMVDKALRQS